MAFHLAAIARDQVVFARFEQTLLVIPRTADQRQPAGHRLERAYGRNAGQKTRIGPARHVHSDSRPREYLGNIDIREPAAVGNAGTFQSPKSFLRITYAKNRCTQAEPSYWL